MRQKGNFAATAAEDSGSEHWDNRWADPWLGMRILLEAGCTLHSARSLKCGKYKLRKGKMLQNIKIHLTDIKGKNRLNQLFDWHFSKCLFKLLL